MLFPVEDVKKWFLKNQRSFPWRNHPNPYEVWVSEMMLQQTVASVVVHYYEKWMQRFPDIEALASASRDDVIKTWEGLGYYSRACHLHQGAILIMKDFQGEIPDDPEKLLTIPGIGPYTQGAILSFAFHKKRPAIDGNVSRVIARYLALQETLEKAETKKTIYSYVDNILPEQQSWVVSEALIELGALVCKKQPLCFQCPLLSHCVAFKKGLQKEIPQKKPRLKTISLLRLVAIIEHENFILIRKGIEGLVMGHLFEFPYIHITEFEECDNALSLFEKEFGQLKLQAKLPEEKQAFTRYRATLFPYYLLAEGKQGDGLWIRKEELATYPLSSGHKRLLKWIL